MLSHPPGFHEAFNPYFVKYQIRKIYGTWKLCQKNPKLLWGVQKFVEIQKLTFEGNFQPNRHDFKNNTTLKMYLPVQSLAPPGAWCAHSWLEEPTRQTFLRSLCAAAESAGSFPGSLCHVWFLTQKHHFKKRLWLLSNFFVSPIGRWHGNTYLLRDTLKVNVQFDLLFLLGSAGTNSFGASFRFPTEWSEDLLLQTKTTSTRPQISVQKNVPLSVFPHSFLFLIL